MVLAYFDCFSGISGDMTLGALVNLGVPVEWLKEQIKALPLSGFDLTAESVSQNGIAALKVNVHTEETHHHRNFTHIEALIQKSPLADRIKNRALLVFEKLAEAEAKVHGCDKDSVHFHEVGAIDAIVDIVGTCLGLDYLGIEAIVSSPLPLGSGFINCDHGTIPVPAPAVLELLKGVPTYGGAENKEMVTPTGAAILMGNRADFGDMPAIKVQKIGYGAGTHRMINQPNLLRVVVGEPFDQSDSSPTNERLLMVETCIDDMNPEYFGYLMEVLFAEGALDVYWTPVQMKKNRPGTLISVLCTLDSKSVVMNRLLSETTTLGVRFYEVFRQSLHRENIEVDSAFGPIAVKRIVTLDGSERYIPEFDVCRRLAQKERLPLLQVYETVLKTAKPYHLKDD